MSSYYNPLTHIVNVYVSFLRFSECFQTMRCSENESENQVMPTFIKEYLENIGNNPILEIEVLHRRLYR